METNNQNKIQQIIFDQQKWESNHFDFYILDEKNIKPTDFPQEDIMQFSHKHKDLIVDVGVYGEESKFPGYTILVIGNGDWQNPVSKKIVSSSLNLKKEVEDLLQKLG